MDNVASSIEENLSNNVDETSETEEAVGRHKSTAYGITIDSSRIKSVPLAEQSNVLRDLGIDVFNQEEFEEGVLKQVDEAIAVKETEALITGWEKDLKAVDEDIKATTAELEQIDKITRALAAVAEQSYDARRRAESVNRQRQNKLRQLQKLEAKQKSLHHKLGIGEEEIQDDDDQTTEQTQEDVQIAALEDRIAIMKQLEKERDELIKTGKMTPFGGFINNSASSTQLLDSVQTCEACASHSIVTPIQDRSAPKQDMESDEDDIQEEDENDLAISNERLKQKRSASSDSDDEYVPGEEELRQSWNEREDRHAPHSGRKKVKHSSRASKKKRLNVQYVEDDAVVRKSKIKRVKDTFRDKPLDDGDEHAYQKRIREVRIQALLKKQGLKYDDDDNTDDEDLPDMEFDDKYKVPGKIWHKLYKYQQTGVKWLWELHCQQAGGIVGDEMGLGKTIQTIAFLAGLKYSKISSRKSRHDVGLGPILIVCPVTVLHQWVKEFHKWWPDFRVAVLHDTGSFTGTKHALVKKMCAANGVVVTSYSGVRGNQDALLAQRWDYVILDEGHKIRNPDAEITLTCKQIRTPHRIILSGSPMQNNLRELWSLFDFVFPGKLGTLPVFMAEFSVPITTGGYANASKVQVQTAYKCACVLRDTINPYLLRRLKKDVRMDLELPTKSEQVLFCRLSDEQRELYEQYLDSREVQSILAGNYKVFPGLIMLRKICNHPDLTSVAGSLIKAKQDEEDAKKGVVRAADRDEGYGDWRRAGKMIVVEALLKMWKAQGHRVLLFSQTRQMLNILEGFVNSRGYSYRRMDGSTSIATRQPLVNKFNQDESIFVFLLTTRVGGLGVNLTGADRVIIYDPDWNPSTDTQARERSWRIGQWKQVTIYRLLTTGTIEEKIYHRQIFKQFLTNRVLEDPKQRRFFKTNDLYELFTLDDSYKKQGTETGAIFAGTNCEVKVPGSHKKRRDPRSDARAVSRNKREKTKTARKRERAHVQTRVNTAASDGGAFSIDSRDIEDVMRQKAATKESDTVEKPPFEQQKVEGGKHVPTKENVVVVTGNAFSIDSRDIEDVKRKKASSNEAASTKTHLEIQKVEGIHVPNRESSVVYDGEASSVDIKDIGAVTVPKGRTKITLTTEIPQLQQQNKEERRVSSRENAAVNDTDPFSIDSQDIPNVMRQKATKENATTAKNEKGEDQDKKTENYPVENSDKLVSSHIGTNNVGNTSADISDSICASGYTTIGSDTGTVSAWISGLDRTSHRKSLESTLKPGGSRPKGIAVPTTSFASSPRPSCAKSQKNREGRAKLVSTAECSIAGTRKRVKTSHDSKLGKKRKLSSLSDKELRKKLRVREKKKQKKIEGHVIENLDYHEVFSAGSGANETDAERKDVKHDDVILKTLFKRSGVHSALQHDVIMESGNADYTLVENEANRVAQQAVQALKKSRQQCLGARSGIPTWTGASGSSGFTDTRRPKLRFGKKRPPSSTSTEKSEETKSVKRSVDEPLFSGAVMGMETADNSSDPASSTDLLARMRARNNILPSEGTGASAQAPKTEHDELIAEMSDFVTSHGRVPGQASTNEIVDRFRDKLPQENSAVFRAMLRQICDFSRGPNKDGIWRLKSTFS